MVYLYLLQSLDLQGPYFLFPSCPLSLLTHLGPSPSDSHRPLPIYSTDPLMRTFLTDVYHIQPPSPFFFQFPGSMQPRMYFTCFPLPAFGLVRQLPATMYISRPYILELGLKPDLVYNPRCVASTTKQSAFYLPHCTIHSHLIPLPSIENMKGAPPTY